MKYSPNSNRTFEGESDFICGLSEHPVNDEKIGSAGVPLLVRNGKVYTDDSDNHVLIFGNTGSKKSRNFIIPSVFLLGRAGENMIISDPKGEIYRYSSGSLAMNGYRIKVINFRDMDKSARWNPLLLPYILYKNGNKDKGTELVADFCYQLTARVRNDNDKFWENQAADALVGIILALFEAENDPAKINMKSVLMIRGSIEVESSDERENVFWNFVKSFPVGTFVRTKLSSIYSLRMTEKTLNCILATMDSMLSIFAINQQLLELISATDIDMDDIFREKTAVFLITPDEKNIFNFLVSVFVKQYYEIMIDKAHKMTNGFLPIRINFVLDEFSNFPKIEDMPAMISAARSRNIRFVLVVQSKQQLTAMYKDDAETIKSNCKDWIFLASREIELLEEISKLCGTYIDRNGSNVPIITITQLQQLKIGYGDSEALILRHNCKPYISTVKDLTFYPQSEKCRLQQKTRMAMPIKYFDLKAYLDRMYLGLKANIIKNRDTRI